MRVTRGWLIAALLIAGCDAHLGPDEGPTRVRFVNAVPDALSPLEFVLQGGPSTVLARGAASDYLAVDGKQYALSVHDDSDGWTVSGDLNIVPGLNQTLIAFSDASDPGALLVSDEPGTARTGQFLIRFLHLAPHLTSALDVHFLQTGEVINPGSAAVTDLTYPANGEHFAVNVGTWRVVLSDAGTSDIVLDSGPLDFASRTNHTVVIYNEDDATPRLIHLIDQQQ
ncbi:MAG TPA: DUF4397 domain-containing protein [Longimicrobiales bacterium]|nr:DUF4397 domain-containing protein [Longimicrobiales bacterium]